MSRWILNGLLLVIVVGLGVAVYSRQKTSNVPKARLFALGTDITSASIAAPGRETIRLQKSGGVWRLEAPVVAATDPFEINGITSLAGFEVHETLPLAGLNLAELGLQTPERTITINGVALAFGGKDPLQDRRYVRRGQEVLLIDDPASAALDADYQDLVSKKLFAANAKINRIQLPDGSQFTRATGGDWLDANGQPVANAAGVTALANAWQDAEALWNEMADGAASGETVTLGFTDGSSRQLVVVARDPQLTLYDPAVKLRRVLSLALVDTLLKVPAATPSVQPSNNPAAASLPKAL